MTSLRTSSHRLEIEVARPFINERLLMGRKESNETNKTN